MTAINRTQKASRALALMLVVSACPGLLRAADGALDPSFGLAGVARTGLVDATLGVPAGPVVQADGRIVTCAGRNSGGSSGRDFLVARYTADGRPDATFGMDGSVTVDFAGGVNSVDGCNAVLVQPDGRIVVAGTAGASENIDFGVARLNPDGSPDSTFGLGTGKTMIAFDLGGGNGDVATGIALQADGRIVVTGWVDNVTDRDFGIVRLLQDGRRDVSFNLTGRAAVAFDATGSSNIDEASSVAIDAQGRIVVGGIAASAAAGGAFDFAVVRLLPSGRVDAAFGDGGRARVAFADGASGASLLYSLIIQSDGKIVMAGDADVSLSIAVNDLDVAVARLRPDGSPDDSFGEAGQTVVGFDLTPGSNEVATGISQQPDGKLLLVGAAVAGGEAQVGIVARLGEDGTRDMTFGTDGMLTLDLRQSSPAVQLLSGLAFQGNNLIVSGVVQVGAGFSALDTFVARLAIDTVFGNGFD